LPKEKLKVKKKNFYASGSAGIPEQEPVISQSVSRRNNFEQTETYRCPPYTPRQVKNIWI